MKFTSEDLMKAIGLQVGDKVKVKTLLKDGEDEIYTIDNTGGFCLLDKDGKHYSLFKLMERDFEILPKPKRVGEFKCEEECNNCPLVATCAMYTSFEGLTLYEILERNDSMAHDQEIYDLLKARLDKVVLE